MSFIESADGDLDLDTYYEGGDWPLLEIVRSDPLPKGKEFEHPAC
ncbi:hypothetical protein [Kitasatospora sp. NPDC098663]